MKRWVQDNNDFTLPIADISDGQGSEPYELTTNPAVQLLVGGLLMAGLFWIGRYNFLLFHSLSELFSVAVAWSVFLIAWNSRRFIKGNVLLLLGVAYLVIGGIDLLHTLAYKGMGVFPGPEAANPPTQLWIIARYLESLSLLAFVGLTGKQVRLRPVVAVYTGILVLSLLSVFFWKNFPACFIDGSGLTPFKKISEYVISIILLITAVILFKKQRYFDSAVYRFMMAAIGVTILGELCFTFYVSVYGTSNLAGHFFKIFSFYLIYLALVRSGITRPQDVVFRELNQSRRQFAVAYNKTPLLMGFSRLDDGTYIDVNNTFVSITGYSRQEAIGSSSVNIGIISLEDRERIKKELQAKGCMEDFELSLYTKNGSRLICRIWGEIISIQGQDHLLVMASDITEQHAIQSKRMFTLDLLKLINKKRNQLSEFASTHSLDDLLKKSLAEAEELTDSSIGFFHFVSEDQKTIHLRQWSARTIDAGGRIGREEKEYSLDKTGIWADCVRQRKAIIHNDYSVSNTQGDPDGHVPIVRELTVPVISGGLVTAVLGVGNKDMEYSIDDAALIQELANMTWNIVVQKKSENQWKDLSRSLETLIGNLPGMVYRCANDSDWSMEYVSQGCVALTGYQTDEFTGTGSRVPYASIIHADHRARVWDEIQEKISKGASFELEYSIVHRDGTLRWVWERGVKVPGDSPSAVCLEGFVTDITYKRKQESQLRQLAMVIDQAAESIVITDEIGEIEYVNPAFETITGYLKEEVLGQNPRILNSGEQDPVFYQRFWQTISSGKAWRGRFMNIKKDGSGFTQEGSVTPVLDSNNQIVNYVAVMLDISEEILMEEQLSNAQRLEAIGTLAGGIAHDFNNILFPIVGLSELLQEDLPINSPLQSHVSKILKASMRAKDLVKQILSFSQQDHMEPKAIRLHPIVKEVLKLMRASLPSTIKIEQDIKQDCPPVLADPTQIHQIVMNLTTNAFHAMEDTGGVLKITLTHEKVKTMKTEHFTMMMHEYCVCIAVSDTGEGMEKGVRDRLFEPYFTTKAKGKGTGLGLSVVHGIVEKHNGVVEVESRLGAGTTFKVFFPCLTDNSIPEVPCEKENLQGGTERILLVDDEVLIISTVKQQLDRMGYRVTVRTSSIEALEVFRKQPADFDLVITDLTMPNMTGDRLTWEIKRIRPDIPVILCTGFSDKINPEKALAMGIDEYILKPVIRKDIDAVIRKVLKEK